MIRCHGEHATDVFTIGDYVAIYSNREVSHGSMASSSATEHIEEHIEVKTNLTFFSVFYVYKASQSCLP